MTSDGTATVALGAQIILTSDLPLPTKPPPPVEGQVVAWVDLLDVEAGGFWFKGRFFPVDESEMDRLISVHRDMTREGYQPPHLVEHNRNGETRGAVLALEKWADPRRAGRPTLIAALSFTDPDALSKIARKELRYFSPGIGSVEDSRTGKAWPNCIKEVSRVAAPHRKTGEHILGAEQGAPPTPTTGDTMEDDKTPDAGTEGQDRLDMMEARLAACETTLGEIKGAMGEIKTLMEGIKGAHPDDADPQSDPAPGASNPPSSPALAEVEALRQEMAQIREERDRARFDAGFGGLKGRQITLSETHADALYSLSKANPEAFKRITGAAEEAKPPAAGTKAAGKPAYDPWGNVSLGEGGGATDAPKKVAASDIGKMAHMAGISHKEMHQRLIREGRF